jgi:hypothetical protein
MTLTERIILLQRARAIEAIEFYVTKSDNREAAIGCRLWSLSEMSELQCGYLVDELNSAIRPILQSNVAAIEERIARHYST